MSFLGYRPLSHGYQFSSGELSVDGKDVTGFNSFSSNLQASVGEFYGASSQVQFRTKGKLAITAGLTIYKEDADELITLVAATGLGGFMENPFLLTRKYSEVGDAKKMIDTFAGCRIVDMSEDQSDSEEALVVTFELKILRAAINGKPAFGGVGDLANGVAGFLGS